MVVHFCGAIMSKAAQFLLAATLTSVPSLLLAQSQSPDQQQEENSKNKPSPQVNRPQNDTGQPQIGQSPDTQQEKNAPKDPKHAKNTKNNARQAHGTPRPKRGTNTTPQ
jgi:hypothetical protein